MVFLETLYGRIVPWATNTNIGLLFAIVLCFMTWLLPAATASLARMSGMPDAVLDKRFRYTPDDAYALLSAYGVAGRRRYVRNAVMLDLLFPFAYGMFLTLVGMRVSLWLCTPSGFLRHVSLLPLLAVGFDYLENTSLVVLALKYPRRMTPLARLSSTFTSLKWVTIATSVGLIAIGLVLGSVPHQRLCGT
jgi:hypothetical protein